MSAADRSWVLNTVAGRCPKCQERDRAQVRELELQWMCCGYTRKLPPLHPTDAARSRCPYCGEEP